MVMVPSSDDTILRNLKRRANAQGAEISVRVFGVDDWAWARSGTEVISYDTDPSLNHLCAFNFHKLNVSIQRNTKDFSTEFSFVQNMEFGTLNVNGNYTTNDRNILQHPEFKKIKKFIQTNIKTYSDEILSLQNSELYITQSWLNFSGNQQGHHTHSHPNSIVSGVFYFESDENDKIKFHRSYDSDPFPKTEYDILNSETWWFPATKGKLILFSSKTVHSVDIRESNVPRISLSFNTYFKGQIGHPSHLNYLKL